MNIRTIAFEDLKSERDTFFPSRPGRVKLLTIESLRPSPPEVWATASCFVQETNKKARDRKVSSLYTIFSNCVIQVDIILNKNKNGRVSVKGKKEEQFKIKKPS